MAVTALTVSQATSAGLLQALAAANADGSTFVNDSKTFLIVKNTNAVTCNVTVTSNNCSQGQSHSETVAIVQNATKIVGPFPKAKFNNSSDGLVHISFNAVTDVTIQAIKL
jgi:hypothetical protein